MLKNPEYATKLLDDELKTIKKQRIRKIIENDIEIKKRLLAKSSLISLKYQRNRGSKF